jgi:DNA processing protein
MTDRDALWLWLCSADGVGPTTANDLWAGLRERGLQLEDFYDLGKSEWAGEFGLNSRVVRGLAQKKSQMNEIVDLAESLREAGVRLVSLERPHYPASLRSSLKRTAPPLLYALGNVSLLSKSCVAVAGARDASGRGLLIAQSIGEALARQGIVLVSGGAHGTDNAAHAGALRAGGATILVLSCGILRYRPDRAVGEMADVSSALYVSELPPNMTWQVGGAMARNRIVCGLASAAIIVEAKESGGTIQAAKTASSLGKPLFVVQFDHYDAHSAGNPSLLRKGGRPLKAECDPSGESWRVDIAPVVAEIERSVSAEPPAEQADLFSP